MRWVSYILETTKCGSMGYKQRSRNLARSRFWDNHDHDSYECPDCGRGLDEIRSDTFEVHHKDGDAYNNSMENLVALCRPCHNIREGKKPSLNEIKHLLNQNTRSLGNRSKTDLFLHLDELRDDLYNGVFPHVLKDPSGDRDRLWKSLGYDSGDEMLAVRPRNRREAAIFRAGRHLACKEVHSKFDPIFKSVLNDVECDLCGSSRATGAKIQTLPHEKYGTVDDRKAVCGKCGRDLLDSIPGSSKTHEEVASRLNSNTQKPTTPSTSKDKQNDVQMPDICHRSGCDNDPDVIYQLDEVPDQSGDKSILYIPACRDCVKHLNKAHKNGKVVADIDYLLENWVQ